MVSNSPKGLKHSKSSTFGINTLSFCICMAQCLTSSQTFLQFIRPSSLLSYTSNTDCILKYSLETNYSNKKEWIESKDGSFQVRGAVGNLSFGRLCKCISKSEPGCWKSNSTESFDSFWRNKQAKLRTNSQITKRMDLDAKLPNNLSQNNNAVLSNHSNQWESFSDQPGIDEKINHPIAAADSSQPIPVNLDSSGLHGSTTMTNQHSTAHLHWQDHEVSHLLAYPSLLSAH